MNSNGALTKPTWRMLLPIVLIALFIPIESTTVPEWTVIVVDASERPVEGALVRQVWQNYSFEENDHEQDLRTGSDGRVVLPERKSHASAIRRITGPIRQLVSTGVHASFGPKAYVIVIANGHEGSANWQGEPESRVKVTPIKGSR